MFSSIFSQGDPKAPNFHPSTTGVAPGDLCGPLKEEDLHWVCGNGVETQIFYNFTPDGKFVMIQVIHAFVGLAIYPTIQFVVHIFDPATKERVWSSTNVSNFAPLPGKLSSKCDEFAIIHDSSPKEPGAAESYSVSARPTKDVQVSATITRTAEAPGWRIGKAPHGGRSFYGRNIDRPDGFMVHRFWPRTSVSGQVVYKGKAIDISGSGMLVMAIQGMRPDNIACRWDFGHFQSEDHGGVAAIQMQFTTPKSYGPSGSGSGNVKVAIGSLVVGGKLVLVTGETQLPGQGTVEGEIVSRAIHVGSQKDPENGHPAPTGFKYVWRGPSLVHAGNSVGAELQVEVGPPNAMKGLVEKVDVLAEVPAPVKVILNAAAGIKPIVYQLVNPAELAIHGLEGGDITAKGWVYTEATFISESP
ncbi:oxidative stress survival, Svf1-like protein [Auriculariales sp. MPI-PUGE-AT-0066]|nr:oxidative stress survival, Svf1-like protein [Auriculariales sp. MPI-PUGE-AT-0066]